MSEITHDDYMSLVERIEKLENDLRWIAGDILVKESQEIGLYKAEGININPRPKGSRRPKVPPAAPPKPNRCTCCGGCKK